MEHAGNTSGSLKENWEKYKEKFRSGYSRWIDSDLYFEPGKKDEMFRKMKIRLGILNEASKQI